MGVQHESVLHPVNHPGHHIHLLLLGEYQRHGAFVHQPGIDLSSWFSLLSNHRLWLSVWCCGLARLSASNDQRASKSSVRQHLQTLVALSIHDVHTRRLNSVTLGLCLNSQTALHIDIVSYCRVNIYWE